MMKKKLFTILAVAAFGFANAQDLTSKKGETILPESGDWALGIDASPFLQYFGNFFGKTAVNASPAFDFTVTAPMAIYGKYFVDAETAYRGRVRIGFGSTSLTSGASAADSAVVKTSGSNIVLGGGIEKRKGSTRLQGFYGGEAMIMLGSGKVTNEYETPVSATNPVATRNTEVKNGGTFGFGLRGFVGAEYFVLPKLSVGGEFGWGLALNTNGEGETSTEGWDAPNTTVITNTIKTAKASNFSLDTDNLSGSLNVIFHF